MYTEVNQTDEEKLAMYMKLTKSELAKMLIEANRNLAIVSQPLQWVQPYNPTVPYPNPYPIICTATNPTTGTTCYFPIATNV